MSTGSIFSITGREASRIVAEANKRSQACADNNNAAAAAAAAGGGGLRFERACYTMTVSARPVYSGAALPQCYYQRLPRLINDIPLGAGRLAPSESLGSVRWMYIEGGDTFLSVPMTAIEADECRRRLRDTLVKQAKAVFGDATVKVSIVLSRCHRYDDEFIVNDIACSSDEGLHFSD